MLFFGIFFRYYVNDKNVKKTIDSVPALSAIYVIVSYENLTQFHTNKHFERTTTF